MSHIEIKYKDKTYKLYYTRRSIMQMEADGFKISEAEDKPLSTLDRLFHGAFLAEHGYIDEGYVDEIFDNIPHEGLFEQLAKLYEIPILALAEDKGETKNATWEMKD